MCIKQRLCAVSLRVLHSDMNVSLAMLECPSYRDNFSVLVHGRPKINELFVGRTHCLCSLTVCFQAEILGFLTLLRNEKTKKRLCSLFKCDIVPLPFQSSCSYQYLRKMWLHRSAQ